MPAYSNFMPWLPGNPLWVNNHFFKMREWPPLPDRQALQIKSFGAAPGAPRNSLGSDSDRELRDALVLNMVYMYGLDKF